MTTKTYTFELAIDFELVNEISAIDKFGGSWENIVRREGRQTLRELKSIATVQSIGASTRIEGSKMTNDEVRALIFDSVRIEKFEERDRQEVLGYFNALDIISETYKDIPVTESSLKNLHNTLLKLSDKDHWHKGNYKQLPNSVEAEDKTTGKKTTIFDTTPPGIETEDAMRGLIDWYAKDTITHPIVKTAVFVYDFLSIHPFQDGNGRLSRLIGTLLLLKHGYSWVQYVSFEHEIEQRKGEYYKVLMECQQQRPGENISSWVRFFLSCLNNIQNKLEQKLEVQKSHQHLSHREKMIHTFIENHPGTKSGEIAERLNIPLPSVKKILTEMASSRLIAKHGTGRSTYYTSESINQIKNDIVMTFTQQDSKKEFILTNRNDFIEIKQLILKPKFEWTKPDDWSNVLMDEELMFTITLVDKMGSMASQTHLVASFNNPMYYQPVFSLPHPIVIPSSFWNGNINKINFPVKATIEVSSVKNNSQFDVLMIHDVSLS
ncbi:MAG: Fic family protein [Bacteroidia bacterium]